MAVQDTEVARILSLLAGVNCLIPTYLILHVHRFFFFFATKHTCRGKLFFGHLYVAVHIYTETIKSFI